MFFFFNDTATTQIYTLSLHDALPIFVDHRVLEHRLGRSEECGHVEPVEAPALGVLDEIVDARRAVPRSEEHTSELQSRLHLVCRLLLEKKKRSEEMSSDRR